MICWIGSVDPVGDLCLTNQIYSALLNAFEFKEITEAQNVDCEQSLFGHSRLSSREGIHASEESASAKRAKAEGRLRDKAGNEGNRNTQTKPPEPPKHRNETTETPKRNNRNHRKNLLTLTQFKQLQIEA